jgi:beta-phosphoglucomutase
MRPRAVILDFNGTLSNDEPLLERLHREILAEFGATITAQTYWAELAGLSDPEMIERGLRLGGVEPTDELRAAVLRARLARYRDAVAERPTISARSAALVRALADEVPLAIASGAVREEVDHVLAQAGLADTFTAIVTIEDVERGKPDPASYRVALDRLAEATGTALRPAEALVLEDSEPGVAAARAAGMPCVTVAGDVEDVLAALLREAGAGAARPRRARR